MSEAITDPTWSELYFQLVDVYTSERERTGQEATRLVAVADDLRRHDGQLDGLPDTLHRLAKIVDAIAWELGAVRK